MRISYSAIDTYKTCPLKYKYQEIDRIKAPKSREAVFGTVLHGALKFMFSRDPLYPTLDEVINFYSQEWVKRNVKSLWPDEKTEKIFNEHGKKILSKFYKENQPWNFNVIDIESRFEAPIKDGKSGETHVLAGVIDRIDKPDGETYEIVDYKTGKRLPSQEKLDNNLQLSIYQLGLLHRWPHLADKKVKLTLHYLPHGEKISTERSKEALERTKKEIVSTINEIEAKTAKANDFSPTPSELCNWCGYKPICPVWKHLYEKEKNVEDESKIQEIIKEYFEIKGRSQENTSRLKELQAVLADYMRDKNVLRLFGSDGYVSKTLKTAAKYDFDKVKAVLEPLGKWQDILKADEKKLASILSSLPSEAREKIEASATLKTSEVITAVRKKISADGSVSASEEDDED